MVETTMPATASSAIKYFMNFILTMGYGLPDCEERMSDTKPIRKMEHACGLLVEGFWPSLCVVHDCEDMHSFVMNAIRDDVAGRWDHPLPGSGDSSRFSGKRKAVE